jgi:hypothetical protein
MSAGKGLPHRRRKQRRHRLDLVENVPQGGRTAVEGAVAAGARANLAVQTLAVDYAAINSTITTSGEALSGQCASVLDLLTR